jgi:hypothetical protein
MNSSRRVSGRAAKLGVNLQQQRIRALLAQRRIPGARRVGRQWFVPDFKVTPGTRGPRMGQ